MSEAEQRRDCKNVASIEISATQGRSRSRPASSSCSTNITIFQDFFWGGRIFISYESATILRHETEKATFEEIVQV